MTPRIARHLLLLLAALATLLGGCQTLIEGEEEEAVSYEPLPDAADVEMTTLEATRYTLDCPSSMQGEVEDDRVRCGSVEGTFCFVYIEELPKEQELKRYGKTFAAIMDDETNEVQQKNLHEVDGEPTYRTYLVNHADEPAVIGVNYLYMKGKEVFMVSCVNGSEDAAEAVLEMEAIGQSFRFE